MLFKEETLQLFGKVQNALVSSCEIESTISESKLKIKGLFKIDDRIS